MYKKLLKKLQEKTYISKGQYKGEVDRLKKELSGGLISVKEFNDKVEKLRKRVRAVVGTKDKAFFNNLEKWKKEWEDAKK